MSWKPCALMLAAALILAGCGDDEPDVSAATKPETHTPSAEPTASSSPSPSPTSSPSPTRSARPKAADGRNLGACKDGECEVEIKTGDMIRLGNRVKAKPRVDWLAVVDISRDGPTFALSSGMTTTAYGGIEINGGLSVDTVYANGKRAIVRLSRIS